MTQLKSITNGVFRSYDVEIEIVQTHSDDEYQDLTQDIMMLIASFSGKLYRKRVLERRKTQTEAE
jgi:predicted site-specific integrase-resolvase